MIVETPSSGGVPPSRDPAWQAAEKLHAALFADMLRHSGLTEALSTGEGSLDSFTSLVIDQLAADLAGADSRTTEQLYAALRDR